MPDLTLAQIAAIEATARQVMEAIDRYDLVKREGTVDRDARFNFLRADENYRDMMQPELALQLCQMARPKTCGTCEHHSTETGYGTCTSPMRHKMIGLSTHFETSSNFGCICHEARQGQET